MKTEKYSEAYESIKSLVEAEADLIANMANVSAMLKDTFHFWWVGFYRVDGEELILGPFQGPIACTRIRKGRGVCGTSWAKEQTIVVPDVEEFPGHIACSSASKSEIVIPVRKGNEIIAVLDIDSEFLNTFDETDQLWLEKICKLFS
ncbi:MAG: GAF domain-containing protein [Bacteroidaceae bacterium]|nr:GAF domain-containing protein [Bacteroidaceae bacterium]